MDWTNNGGQRHGHSSELSAPLSSTHRQRYVALVAALIALPAAFGISPDMFGDEKSLCSSSAVVMARVMSAKCVEKHSPSFPGAEFERLNKMSFCSSSKYEVQVEEILNGAAFQAGERVSFVALPMFAQSTLMPSEEAAEADAVGKLVLFAMDSPPRPLDGRSREWALATLVDGCAKLNITRPSSRSPLAPADAQR